jgi:hypothetical protein
MEVLDFKWDRSDTEPVDEYTIFCGKGNKNHELVTRFFRTEENHISS